MPDGIIEKRIFVEKAMLKMIYVKFIGEHHNVSLSNETRLARTLECVLFVAYEYWVFALHAG